MAGSLVDKMGMASSGAQFSKTTMDNGIAPLSGLDQDDIDLIRVWANSWREFLHAE
jgi:hypothetical protein